MKLLLISNMYPSEKHSNYGVFVKNSETALKKNTDIIIRKVVIKGRTKSKAIKLLSYLRFYLASIFEITFSKYDIVYFHYISHNLPLVLWAKFLKRKIVINVHGTDVLAKRNNKIESLILKSAKETNLIVTPSRYYLDVVKKKYGVRKEKIFVSPSGGINTKVFLVINTALNINSVTEIGFVSRIDKDKGWDDFVKALEAIIYENPHIKIKAHIIGDGAETNQLNQLIISKGFFKLYGNLGQVELVRILNQCNVFVFPTKRKTESLGLVGVEAMACGLPVIGSKIGGLETYIKDGFNGYFFEPGNIHELKKKILKYIDLDIKEKEIMRENALNTAHNYDSSVVSKNLYKRLLEL